MEKKLDKNYWDQRYHNSEINWDVGTVSTPLKIYIDQLQDKNLSILVPGCGNAYEAEYLLQQGFTNITLIDLAPSLVDRLREKFKGFYGKELQLRCGDFFELEAKYDLILEQTFFCALDPALRNAYADKMADLLKDDGKLVGVLFNRRFETGPPFGGSTQEYTSLFRQEFNIKVMEECYNSIVPRAGSELFIILEKK
jgi:SAM-dependent methyltransferase